MSEQFIIYGLLTQYPVSIHRQINMIRLTKELNKMTNKKYKIKQVYDLISNGYDLDEFPIVHLETNEFDLSLPE